MLKPRLAIAVLMPTLLVDCGGPGNATGPDATSPSCNKGTLTVGGSTTGNTGSNRCQLPDGNGNVFQLVVTQSQAVTITMSGNAFPGFVGVYTSDGQLLWSVNAAPLAIPIVLGPGTYLLRIDSMSGADGPYTLSAPLLAVTACNNGVYLTKGATYTGALNVTSCVIPDGRKFQEFKVVSGVPSTLSFTATFDRRGSVSVTGGSLQDFGPGSYTGSVATTKQGVFQLGGFTVLSQSASAIPMNYTVKVE